MRAGFVSWRSHVWTDVDPDRTGILPFVWDASFGFEAYVDYALDVPMYFVYHGGRYEDATQQRCTFREYMDGRLPLHPGARPHSCVRRGRPRASWGRHCSVFPDTVCCPQEGSYYIFAAQACLPLLLEELPVCRWTAMTASSKASAVRCSSGTLGPLCSSRRAGRVCQRWRLQQRPACRARRQMLASAVGWSVLFLTDGCLKLGCPAPSPAQASGRA